MLSEHETLVAYIRRHTLEARGLTMGALADRLHITRPALSNVLNANAALSIPLALRIELEFGLKARDLLIRQLDEELLAARSQMARV